MRKRIFIKSGLASCLVLFIVQERKSVFNGNDWAIWRNLISIERKHKWILRGKTFQHKYLWKENREFSSRIYERISWNIYGSFADIKLTFLLIILKLFKMNWKAPEAGNSWKDLGRNMLAIESMKHTRLQVDF